MNITERIDPEQATITQSNYPALGDIVIMSWSAKPHLSFFTVAVWHIKPKPTRPDWNNIDYPNNINV